MDTEPTASISGHFASLEGPRLDRTKLQQLLDIHLIAICAIIFGADDWGAQQAAPAGLSPERAQQAAPLPIVSRLTHH